VTVPQAATTGKVTVSNANGSATSPSDFIVASLARATPCHCRFPVSPPFRRAAR
jgi:hypothetical protein